MTKGEVGPGEPGEAHGDSVLWPDHPVGPQSPAYSKSDIKAAGRETGWSIVQKSLCGEGPRMKANMAQPQMSNVTSPSVSPSSIHVSHEVLPGIVA